MLRAIRETARIGGSLWATVGRVLRAQWHTLLLLFLLGWAGYYLTVMVAGLLAPRWPWAVIPVMGAGCLIQLLVTLMAYRLSIRQAEHALDAPPLPQISFMTMVSNLLVPFTAAYSAFGFFTGYARDAVNAASAMVGTLADVAFLGQVNPTKSTRTLLVSVTIFAVLWLAARAIRWGSAKTGSGVLGLLAAFVSSCSTFLVLFSIFRLSARVSLWLSTREYVAWKTDVLAWLGGLVHLDVPQAFALVWGWLSGTVWPVFWYALSQPILWLAVVALVGGMQFVDVDTVWGRLRERLGLREHAVAEGLAKRAGKDAVGAVSGLLPLLHLLSVILRSGVPFLGALVVSYAAMAQAGAWLAFLVQRLIGPLPARYVFLLEPAERAVDLVVTPCLTAVLLAVAYVRLRRDDESLAFNRPTGVGWRPVVAALLSLALAVGINAAAPPSPDRVSDVRAGVPTTFMGTTVVVDDLRVGRAVTGGSYASAGGGPIPALGVFVVVRVSVTGHGATTVDVAAQVGGVSYPTWDRTGGVGAPAGFRRVTDLVFEVPADGLDGLTLRLTLRQPASSTLGYGVFTVPPGVPVADVVTADNARVLEVP